MSLYSWYNEYGSDFRCHISDKLPDSSANNGGSTDYYELPVNATELQDLIEHKNMNFATANCFKAIYRLDDKKNNPIYEWNKIIWFANRELRRIGGKDEL